MPRVAQIWRHPIKGIGAEPLDRVTLDVARPLPGDRAWAVLTGDAEETGSWQPCRNFARGCYAPALMAVTTETVGDGFTLRHPDRPDLTIEPARDGAALVDWIRPLWPQERPAPHSLIAAPAQGMTDADYASVSVLNLASLDALSGACGQPLDPRRFRGNIWLSDLPPWEEFGWIGSRLTIGEAELEVVERIGRCRATETNPENGVRDANTLAVLRDQFGHTDFGIMARVICAGGVTIGAEVQTT